MTLPPNIQIDPIEEEDLPIIDLAGALTKLAAAQTEVAGLLSNAAPGAKVTAAWSRVVTLFGRQFFLAPAMWSRYAGPTDLDWKSVEFDTSTLADVPDDKIGVYGISIIPPIQHPPQGDYLIYVGMTKDQNLRQRYGQHLDKVTNYSLAQYKLSDAVRLWHGWLKFSYAPVVDATTIEAIEGELIAASLPPCNQRFPAGVLKMVNALRD